MEASKGDQKVQKSTNFFFIVHGTWGAQNDRTVVESIFGYQDEAPKCLFFYILRVLGTKRVKKGHYFLFFCMGIWGVQNDRTGVGSIFGYQDDTPKCLFF